MTEAQPTINDEIERYLRAGVSGVIAGEAQELFARGEAQAAQEVPDVGPFDEFARRFPDHCLRSAAAPAIPASLP